METTDMAAEGWYVHSDEDGFGFAMWVHEPSHRCVSVQTCKRGWWHGPIWGADPRNADADGFSVTCRVHDEHGNPVDGEGFWLASLGVGLKLARKVRENVLGDRYQPATMVQLTLDDALGGSS